MPMTHAALTFAAFVLAGAVLIEGCIRGDMLIVLLSISAVLLAVAAQFSPVGSPGVTGRIRARGDRRFRVVCGRDDPRGDA